MTLRIYTLRSKVTGQLYHATGHTMVEAVNKAGLFPSHVILERSQVLSEQGVQLSQDLSISSHTAQYHSPRK